MSKETKETKVATEIVVTVQEKKCGKCGVVKPASNFWKMRSSKDGLQPQCKNCQLGITDAEATKKAEKPAKAAKPAKKAIKTTTKAPMTDGGETEDNGNNAPHTEAKPEKKSKAAEIGSGRRKECSGCTMQVKSTEGGKCLSEDAEKDPEKNAKGTCKHLVQSKTAKKAAKKAKKNA